MPTAAINLRRFTSSSSILALFLGLPGAVMATATQAADLNWTATETHAHPLQQSLSQGSKMASGEPVHVVVSLKMRDRDGLDNFVAQATRPDSPAYGNWITDAQFASRHAPTDAQVKSVVDHLTKSGFVNINVDPNRLLISADGTAGTVRSAFRTEMVHVDVDGRSAFANLHDVVVPKALNGTVLAVLGLQTVDQLHSYAKLADVQPDAQGKFETNAVQPQVAVAAHGFNPTAFQRAYGVGTTPTGANTTVAIISQGNITPTITDLRAFESANGLPQVPTLVTHVGASSSDTSGQVEWDLDSQDIQGMAGGSLRQMIFYAATTLSNANITSTYNRAVTDRTAKIINVSLGECETSANSDGTRASNDQIFQTANAQGQIFSVSSGDSGSHECSVGTPTINNTRQAYPAASPYVVAVGGTRLLVDSAGNYASESAWSGGGGGPSTVEARPSYQASVVSGTRRGVPDIALAGDPATGAIITVNGRATQVGGTSLSSPLFVGLWARIESGTNQSHGFPNPGFYANIPANPSLRHDVTTGSNGPGGGYNAGTGWDFTTGFGSPIVQNLYNFVVAHPTF